MLFLLTFLGRFLVFDFRFDPMHQFVDSNGWGMLGLSLVPHMQACYFSNAFCVTLDPIHVFGPLQGGFIVLLCILRPSASWRPKTWSRNLLRLRNRFQHRNQIGPALLDVYIMIGINWPQHSEGLLPYYKPLEDRWTAYGRYVWEHVQVLIVLIVVCERFGPQVWDNSHIEYIKIYICVLMCLLERMWFVVTELILCTSHWGLWGVLHSYLVRL